MANESIPEGAAYEKAIEELRALGAKKEYAALAVCFEKYRRLFTHDPKNRNAQKLYVCAKDQYACVLSEQTSPDLLEKALRLYTQLTFEMPATELFKENARIVERRIKTVYQEIGARLDHDTLKNEYEKYRTLAEKHPEMSVYGRVRDWIEGQYAYALSRQEDLEYRKTALGLYKDLARRYPKETLFANNRDAVANQVRQMKQDGKKRFSLF